MAKRFRQQDFDECYWTRNHWWKPTTVEDNHPAYYVQHLVCMRCGGERRWRVGKVNGQPMGNNYTMQDGYYHHRKADDDMTPQQLRMDLRLKEIEANLDLQRGSRKRRRA